MLWNLFERSHILCPFVSFFQMWRQIRNLRDALKKKIQTNQTTRKKVTLTFTTHIGKKSWKKFLQKTFETLAFIFVNEPTRICESFFFWFSTMKTWQEEIKQIKGFFFSVWNKQQVFEKQKFEAFISGTFPISDWKLTKLVDQINENDISFKKKDMFWCQMKSLFRYNS